LDRQRFASAIEPFVRSGQASIDAPLALLTTFKVGGPADWLIEVRSLDEMAIVVAAAAQSELPITVLGGGSNVLIGDRGIRGAVVRLRFTAVTQPSATAVRADAGVTVNALVRWTIGRGLAGLEAWAGTPGTVGGAIYGNAHFGGRNIGDLVNRVMVMAPDGHTAIVAADQMEFDYDTSRLQRTREIAIWAEFVVRPGAPELLRATARASLAHRKLTQPLDTPSAGCIFQNPNPRTDTLPADVPASAGALVDRAGLKGHRVGGARISPTHANFLLNDGQGTAADIRRLIEWARAAVHARFGVELREEIVMLGEF
jgi:UDP-N-acetylmuramate dehydrogenase